MKILPFHAWAAICFVVCAFAGWQAGGGKEAAALPAARVAPPTKHSKRSPRDNRSAMPEDVRQRLAPIRAARNAEERLRATLFLANSLPVSEMERWYAAEWFDFHDDMESNLFDRISRSRWLAEDPAGLMTHFIKRNNDKTHETAGLWAKQDPRAALAFMESIKNPGDLQGLASAMAGPLAAADPAAAIAQVLKLRAILGEDQGGCISSLIGGLAKSAPGLLESESAAWPAALQKLAAGCLARASLARDFAGGVAALRDAPDGKKRFIAALSNDQELIKAMAEDPDALPPGWFAAAASENPYELVGEDPGKWLDADLVTLGFDEEQSRRLLNYTMSYLGSKDPERAFELLAGDTLEPLHRSNLLHNALSHLARTDKAKAEEWLARLTDPQEIAQARQAIERASEADPGNPAQTPAEWLSGLSGKDDSAMWQYGRMTQTWDGEQIAAATREFQELPVDQKSTIATRLTTDGGHEIPNLLRAEAIAHLLENPAPAQPGPPNQANNPDRLIGSASQLVTSWGRQDPLAAGRWVSSLPEGQGRLWAAKNLAAQWAEYEPAAARQWVASLPTSDRSEVASYLDSGASSKP